MTYLEAIDEINAFYRRRKAQYREAAQFRAAMDYRLAGLIGTAFNNPKKYPESPKAAYPDLFNDSGGGWRESKAQWQKYAEEFNRRREAGRR